MADRAKDSLEQLFPIEGRLLLKKLVPSTIGLLGGGLALTWSLAIVTSTGDGCSCAWKMIQLFYGWPILVGGLTGLAGIALYRFVPKLGGPFILAGSVLSTPIPVLIVSGPQPFLEMINATNASFSLSPTGFFLAPGLIASLLLLLAGLAAIQRTRRAMKLVRDKPSAKYHAFLES